MDEKACTWMKIEKIYEWTTNYIQIMDDNLSTWMKNKYKIIKC
jgi:hypothetical protein